MKIAILIIFLFTYSSAQDKRYFDAPFGGGGGYTPGWIFINMDELNKQLVSFGSGQLTTNGFYTSGGAGFIYIGFIPNLRIGGMGFGGSTSQSALINGVNREAVYQIGGGAFTIEYTLPFVKDIAVSLGASIGAGSIQIELYRNSGIFDWQTIWTDTLSQNISRTLSNSFFMLTSTLNVDIPLYRFISFRLGLGYQVALGKTWMIENERSLANVPTKLNGNAFVIQSGIFLGFFSY